MRVTVDIDEDVLREVKNVAECQGETIGRVLSALARRGLALRATEKPAMREGVPVFPSRSEIITVKRIQRIKDLEGM